MNESSSEGICQPAMASRARAARATTKAAPMVTRGTVAATGAR